MPCAQHNIQDTRDGARPGQGRRDTAQRMIAGTHSVLEEPDGIVQLVLPSRGPFTNEGKRRNQDTRGSGPHPGPPMWGAEWELRGTRGLSHPTVLPRAPWSQRLCKSMEPGP